MSSLFGESRFSMIEVRESPGRGRGVFATQDIAEGTLIEECPVLVLPASDVVHLEETGLGDYYFRWGGTSEEAAIALGFGSLYNHAEIPNAMYVRKLEARTLAFFTLRAIAGGEEIRVSYHGGFGDRGKVWFEEVLGLARKQVSLRTPTPLATSGGLVAPRLTLRK